MSPKGRYWRADGGYQDVPAASPAPVPSRTWRADGGYQDIAPPTSDTPASQQQSTMYYPPWYCTQWAGQQCVRGPVPVAGISAYPAPMPQPYWPAGYVPSQFQLGTQGGTPPPPFPAPPLCEKKEGKNEEKKIENLHAPPALPEGVNYMFDNGHTMLHIFSKAAKIWEPKYQKESLKFKMFKVSTSFTPGKVIERVLCKSGDDCKGWAVTEVIELGDGKWSKGMSIEYTGDKVGNALKTLGWSEKRGDSLPPVWLVVHKV